MDDKKEIITSLRVDANLWKEARKAAIDCDISLGELIDEAVRDWIARKEKEHCQK